MLTDQEVRFGYWGARRLAGLLPVTFYDDPSDLMDADSLFFRKSPASTLTPAQERKRANRWRDALPHMKLKTVILGARVDQGFFDAVTKISTLEALDATQSTVTSIDSLGNCENLTALEFGSRSPVAGLGVLGDLPNLKHLRLFNMRASHDLEFARRLEGLEEFGLIWQVGDSTQTLDSLAPLSGLERLQLVWLSGVKVLRDGLLPLAKLTHLTTLHASFYFPASHFAALREALPSLKYGSPFDEEAICEYCRG